MNIYYMYLVYIINYIKYKYGLKSSSFFYIGKYAKISGLNMISLGQKFYSNRFLRIEVFGDDKLIKLKIGDNVAVGESVHIGVLKYVEIGNSVLIGSRVLITDHNHGKYAGLNQSSPFVPPVERRVYSSGPIIIEENVWIGDGVIVLPNIKIGFGSIIASNSVVSTDIPALSIAAGVPCKVIKRFDKVSNCWEPVGKNIL